MTESSAMERFWGQKAVWFTGSWALGSNNKVWSECVHWAWLCEWAAGVLIDWVRAAEVRVVVWDRAELSVFVSILGGILTKNSFCVHNKLIQMPPESNVFPLRIWKTAEETKKTRRLAAPAKEISVDANLAAVSELKTGKLNSLFFL